MPPSKKHKPAHLTDSYVLCTCSRCNLATHPGADGANKPGVYVTPATRRAHQLSDQRSALPAPIHPDPEEQDQGSHSAGSRLFSEAQLDSPVHPTNTMNMALDDIRHDTNAFDDRSTSGDIVVETSKFRIRRGKTTLRDVEADLQPDSSFPILYSHRSHTLAYIQK